MSFGAMAHTGSVRFPPMPSPSQNTTYGIGANRGTPARPLKKRRGWGRLMLLSVRQLLLGMAALVSMRSAIQPALAHDRTTEAEEANIADPYIECQPYYYPLVATQVSSFPPIWQLADILQNDTNAQAKWNEIQPKVPTNIAVKGSNGTITNNFTSSYDHSDPDCWWTFRGCTQPKLSGLYADVASVPEPVTLGYGFDDGPNCSHNAFYDYLQKNDQKATMFFIGSNVLDWPLEALRALIDGHEICVHTWSHKYMTALANENVFAELYYSNTKEMQAIKLVLNVTVTCWRPPFGDVDDRVRAIATGLGLTTIMWQYDSNDWRANIGNVTAADVHRRYEDLIDRANNGEFASAGTIMLSHELNNFTMSESLKFFQRLKDAFKYIVPVGVAMNWTQPYVENRYSSPSFAQYISGTTTIAPSDVSGVSHGSGTDISEGGIGSASNQGSTSVAPLSGNASENARNGTAGSEKGQNSSSERIIEPIRIGLGFALTLAFIAAVTGI